MANEEDFAMDRNTTAIVASNLTVAYFTVQARPSATTASIAVHVSTRTDTIKVWGIYQKFLKAITDNSDLPLRNEEAAQSQPLP